MPLEIERRFLVHGNEWENFSQNATHFRQGYLAKNIEGWTVRVRISEDDKAWITLKKSAEAYTNHEFEYEIPFEEANSIWTMTTNRLTKIRYSIHLDGLGWVVDRFEGENAPLIIAEIELSTIDQAIHIPSWCIKEITSDKRYSNAALAENPFSKWPPDSKFL